MASATSARTSPLSRLEYEFPLAESIATASASDRADENMWAFIPMPGASTGPGSSVGGAGGAAFYPSLGIGSMNSWSLASELQLLQQQPHHQQHQHQQHSSISVPGSAILRGMVLCPSSVAASPLSLDFDEHVSAYVAGAGADMHSAGTGTGAMPELDLTGLATSPMDGTNAGQFMPVTATAPAAGTGLQDFSLSPEMLFNEQQFEEFAALFPTLPLASTDQQVSSQQGWNCDLQQQQQPRQPQQQQLVQTPVSASDVSSPWSSHSLFNAKAGESAIFVMESPNFSTRSPASSHNYSSQSLQNLYSPSASSPAAGVGQGGLQSPAQIKQGPSPFTSLVVDRRKTAQGSTTATTAPIRKVRGQNSRISKNTRQPPVDLSLKTSIAVAATATATARCSASPALTASGGSCFVIVTPDSVTAHAGRPNPFECFEALRPLQRGRKGPLTDNTRKHAFDVRRLSACFCCRTRKVECDRERPCCNCKKLTAAVPQVMCWRFQDFLPVLFPDFIRGHFRKDDMAAFVAGNIASFTVGGAERPCAVELSSGPRFSATLTIRAKFFTAKTDEVLRCWTGSVLTGNNLRTQAAAPIGLEMTDAHAGGRSSPSSAGAYSSPGGHAQRVELRRKVREYVHDLVAEPGFAELVTEPLMRQTTVPRRVLRIVQNYAQRCKSPLVQRALDIYAMHFVMAQHLCLTRRAAATLAAAEPTLMPRDAPAWVTPRVLSRQIKAVVDELLQLDVQQLFDGFSRSLKPRLQREWGPCTAAFLVLCLFMEAVESAAEGFVAAESEIEARAGRPPLRRRAVPLALVREVDNLPFRQFAWQFHRVYQTHSRDAAARRFNPLLDNACLEGGASGGGLDRDAAEMVLQLRALVQDPECWSELDFLSADPIVPDPNYPFQRNNMAFNYTGRLLSKFLLSFTDERYIFGTA